MKYILFVAIVFLIISCKDKEKEIALLYNDVVLFEKVIPSLESFYEKNEIQDSTNLIFKAIEIIAIDTTPRKDTLLVFAWMLSNEFNLIDSNWFERPLILNPMRTKIVKTERGYDVVASKIYNLDVKESQKDIVSEVPVSIIPKLTNIPDSIQLQRIEFLKEKIDTKWDMFQRGAYRPGL